MAKINLSRRLNVFIDETGEFGFEKRSAALYGVSLVFHEQSADIADNIRTLTDRLSHLNFCSMVHMGDLVSGHEDFSGMDIADRRKIFIQLYKFAVTVKADYHSFFIEKKLHNSNASLEKAIENELSAFILAHLSYFQQFDEIKVYYDGGQKPLSKIINNVFSKLGNYHREPNFDHYEKKLFQVADMLTYIDKLIYKYKHGIKFSRTELGFFNYKQLDRITRELAKHRLKNEK